jgi:hypothetical protein
VVEVLVVEVVVVVAIEVVEVVVMIGGDGIKAGKLSRTKSRTALDTCCLDSCWSRAKRGMPSGLSSIITEAGREEWSRKSF